jgi:hypothetical protein
MCEPLERSSMFAQSSLSERFQRLEHTSADLIMYFHPVHIFQATPSWAASHESPGLTAVSELSRDHLMRSMKCIMIMCHDKYDMS